MKKRLLAFILAIFLIVCVPVTLIAGPDDPFPPSGPLPRPPINFNSAPITFDVDGL